MPLSYVAASASSSLEEIAYDAVAPFHGARETECLVDAGGNDFACGAILPLAWISFVQRFAFNSVDAIPS